MARPRASMTKRTQCQTSTVRATGVRKAPRQPTRESGRLQKTAIEGIGNEISNTLSNSRSDHPFPQPTRPATVQVSQQQKRPREVLVSGETPEQQHKRRRVSFSPQTCKQTGGQSPPLQPANPVTEAHNDLNEHKAKEDPIAFWGRKKRWPKKYFEPAYRTWTDLERDSSCGGEMEQPLVEYVEINGFRYPGPMKKTPASVRRKGLNSNLAASSDQDSSDRESRETKSAPYKDPRYTTLLEQQGSFMKRATVNITDASRSWCHTLLSSAQVFPSDSLFRDDLFQDTCKMIQDRNEARVIQDIRQLIVPSAETLAIYGSKKLKILVENINEGWLGAIAVEGPRPQPDYYVGFRRSAFTAEQLKKTDPLIGTVFETSFFVATYQMYFPFLTCEVKCGAQALDVADRQNAHSMTIAARAVVELFRAVKREKELHREILAFSVSHDHRSVKIYGHYPLIEDGVVNYYRHPIRQFFFTELDGREKWTAYTFTKNVYEVWMPEQLKRITSAIKDLPLGINFRLSQASHSSQASQDVRSQLSQSTAESSQSSFAGSLDVTPTTSFTKPEEPASKKPKAC